MAKMEKVLERAREHLERDETVQAAVMGAYETKILGEDSARTGVFIATERRLIFYATKMFGFDLEAFPYENVSSIEMSKGFAGHSITIFASGNKATIKWISQGDVAAFISLVKERIGKKDGRTAQPPDNIPDQIKKLAELRDIGAVTDEEFQAKKTELLARL